LIQRSGDKRDSRSLADRLLESRYAWKLVVLGAGIEPEVKPVYPETRGAQPQPHDIQVTKPFPMLQDMELANLTGMQNFDV